MNYPCPQSSPKSNWEEPLKTPSISDTFQMSISPLIEWQLNVPITKRRFPPTKESLTTFKPLTLSETRIRLSFWPYKMLTMSFSKQIKEPSGTTLMLN